MPRKSISTEITVASIIAAALLILGIPAFGQAGSAGGTIGKPNKSASGQTTSAEPSRRAKIRSEVKQSSGGKSCGAIAGIWTSNFSGFFGEGDVTVTKAGSYHHSTGLVTGSWTCSHGEFVFTATNGAVETVSMSSDGKRLEKQDGTVWLRR